MWEFEYSDEFISQLDNLPPQIKKKAKDALETLENSDNPNRLGVFKKSLRVLAYELGRSYRILYNVRWHDNVIELITVGDHKQVYGHD